MDNYAKAIGKLMLVYETKLSNARFRKDVEGELTYTIKRQVLLDVITEAASIDSAEKYADIKGVSLHVRSML